MADPPSPQPLFRCRGSDIKDPDNVLAELGWHPRAIERMKAATPLRRGVATAVYPSTGKRKSVMRVAARRTPVIIQEDEYDEDSQGSQPDDGNDHAADEEGPAEGYDVGEPVEGSYEEEAFEGQGEEDQEPSPPKKKKPRRLPVNELVTTSQKFGDDPISQVEADSLPPKRVMVRRKKPKHRGRGRGRRFFENIDITDFHQPIPQPNERPERSTDSYRDGFEGQEAAPTYLYMKIRRSKHKPITGNVTFRFPSLTIVAEKASSIDIEIMQPRPIKKKKKKREEPSEAINVPGDEGQSREDNFMELAQLHTPESADNQRPAFPQTPISKNVRNEKGHSTRDKSIAKMKKIDIRISQELASVSVPRRSPSSGSDDEDDKESASEQGSRVSCEPEPEEQDSLQEGDEIVPIPEVHSGRGSPESPDEQDDEPEPEHKPEQIVPQHLVQSHASLFTPQPITEDDDEAETQDGSWRPQVPDRHRMRLETEEIFDSPTPRPSSFSKAPVRPRRNCSKRVGTITDHTILTQSKAAPGSPILGESQATQPINPVSPVLGQSREIHKTQFHDEEEPVSQISFVPVQGYFAPITPSPVFHNAVSPQRAQSQRLPGLMRQTPSQPSKGLKDLTRSTSRMMGTQPAGTRRTSRFEPHKPPFKKPGSQSSSGVFGG